METICKKDIKVSNSNNNINYISIHFYYYKNENGCKGYYLSMQPIHKEKRDGLTYTEFMGFSGYKLLVCEVARKSKKAESQAKDIINNYIYEGMLNQVLEENNLILADENDISIKF